MLKSLCHLHCRIWKFYRSSVGQKWVVAITGLAMFGWLLGHLLGNFQIFAGRGPTPETTMINEYAAMLKGNIVLLWAVRIIMLKMIVLHVVTTISLTRKNRAARPEKYHVSTPTKSTLASRTMIYGGLFIFFYIIYHLAHFTIGAVHTDLLNHHDLYSSIINSFQVPAVVLIYLAAQFFLGMHLYHGIQSTARTLGLSHPFYLKVVNSLGMLLALFISIGFSSIPLAVITGLIS